MPQRNELGIWTKMRLGGNFWHSIGVRIPRIWVGLACAYKLIHVIGLQITADWALLWFEYP
jgi:hypothetical protein